MLNPVNYIPIFLLFISSIFAQSVEKINITGNNEFDADDYANWSRIIIGEKLVPGLLDSAKTRIASELSDRGYLDFKFDSSVVSLSTDSQKIIINIAVTEGSPTYVNHFIFTGADSTDTVKVFPLFNFLEGEILSKYDIEQSVDNSLVYFENSGNPFAKIIINSVYVYYDSLKNESLADIHLDIQKGKERTIDKIEVLGNANTKDYVITRELRINKGEQYSQSKVDELPKRLNRLRFFDPVQEPQFYINREGEGV
ncbi:MAG TPA: POTRA domain-containing protein, partial [Ignavibacteriaceae bacterium]|nr:POTRA domain-containing protein [Ignavibacteriaceae bacterium]